MAQSQQYPAILVRTGLDAAGLFLVQGWDMVQNLTDRWGDINDYEAEKKGEALVRLQQDEALLNRLREQMVYEDSFIVQVDGQYGILVEFEYLTKESEEREGASEEFIAQLKPFDEMIRLLIERLPAFQEKFPAVRFGVPPEEEIYLNRPALWAFFPDGALALVERQALHQALVSNDDDLITY